MTKKLGWLAALGLVIALMPPAQGGTIGKYDWIPLNDALQPCDASMDPHTACGLSKAEIETIRAAHVYFQCPGTDHVDGGALNAWFVGTSTDSVITNKHVFYEMGSDGGTIVARTPWADCFVRAEGKTTDVKIDSAHLSFDPRDSGNFTNRDRARVWLTGPVEGARPIPWPDQAEVRFGLQIYFVSLMPPAMDSLVVERCIVKNASPTTSHGPGKFETDCDTQEGNSAGLVFRRTDGDLALVPVGMLVGDSGKDAGVAEYNGSPTGPEWGVENSNNFIQLDRKFDEWDTK